MKSKAFKVYLSFSGSHFLRAVSIDEGCCGNVRQTRNEECRPYHQVQPGELSTAWLRVYQTSSSIHIDFLQKLDRQNSNAMMSFCMQDMQVGSGLQLELWGGRIVPWLVKG